MDHQRWSLRVGACVILWAAVLRLLSAGFFQPVADFLIRPEVSSFLLYLETGRIVRFSPSDEVAVFRPEEGESPPISEAFREETALPIFSTADVREIPIRYNCSLRPDLESLVTRDLSWDLCREEPTVLIYHTHATESYTKSPGEEYEESAAFRTLDERYNMISVGDRVTELLEAGGIRVIHDRSTHDYPSYRGSYNSSRKAMEACLDEHPSIVLALDLHRDASGDLHNQMKTHAEVGGRPSAQIMLVVGTNASGLYHPNWEENLSLALKLRAQLERINPGISRHLNLRAQRFNQDEIPGALLVEIGAAGNSHEEAITAAEVLAEAILTLRSGAVTEKSVG